MRIKTLNFLTILLPFFCFSLFAQQDIKIINKPIIFDETRVKLSLAYLKDRHNIKKSIPSIKPRIIVLHWTGSNSFASAFDTFNQSTIQKSRKDLLSASNLNVSAHFLVDRTGAIHRLMPDTLFARHTIGLNYCAIGIENVGSSNFPLTDRQLEANEHLVRYLKSKYNIEYLIGHYEYTKFRNTTLWKEKDPKYQTTKLDPGRDFMGKIREKLKDLRFKDVAKN